MKTLDDVMTSLCHKLGLSHNEFNALFTASPVGDASGAHVAQSLRDKHGIDDDENLADGLFSRGLIGWIDSRILGDNDLWRRLPDAGQEAACLAGPHGPRSVVVGRFDYPTAAEVPDAGDCADECALLETLVRNEVAHWLSQDLGIDTTNLEVRLSEMEPGEIRVYP